MAFFSSLSPSISQVSCILAERLLKQYILVIKIDKNSEVGVAKIRLTRHDQWLVTLVCEKSKCAMI